MSFAERRDNPDVKPKGPACTVGILLNTLDPDEADALRAMLDDPRWYGSSIEDAIKAEGHTVGTQAVSRHRNGRCRCPQVTP